MKLPHRRRFLHPVRECCCAASRLAHGAGAELSDAAGALDRRFFAGRLLSVTFIPG